MSYRVPDRLAYVVDPSPYPGGRVFLRRVPGGDTLVLVGTAAVIWEIAADGVDDLPTAVAEAYGEPVEGVRDDIEEYVATLLSQGLLERDDGRA